MKRTAPIPEESIQEEPTVKRRKRAAGITVEIVNMQRGLPSKYDASVPERILNLAKLGLSVLQMADAMGVAESTMARWLRDREGVREAYHRGRWEHDHGVELSLEQRATGYTYDEVRVVSGVDSLGREYSYTTTTTKHVPGDVTAQVFWLKNRHPDRWHDVNKDSNTTNILNVNMNKTLQLGTLSDKEREMLESVAFKQIEGMNGVTGE